MKKTIAIPLHSITDLITNSSTTIFTWSGSSEGALIEMINELFNSFGIDKKCEDVFDLVLLCDDDYHYTEWLDKKDADELPEGLTPETDIEQLVKDVKECKIPKPDWFNSVEDSENEWNYFTPDTTLYITAKEEKYNKLAKLISNFLYSTDHDGTRDG